MNLKKEQRIKQVWYVTILIYIVSLMISFYMNIQEDNMAGVGMSAVAIITPLIVPLAFKLFRFQPVYEIYIISTVFTYFASLVGSGFHWYSYLGFDKVLHFSSGWMFTTIAVILYFFIKKANTFKDQAEFSIFLIFINAVNITIGAVWEFYEYAMLIFFNNDCINHYSQGVHDTITDMMCATVGGLLLTLLIMRYHRKGKSNFFTNVYEKFYVRNIAKDAKEKKSR